MLAMSASSPALVHQLLERVLVHAEQGLRQLRKVDVHVLEHVTQALEHLLEIKVPRHAAECLSQLLLQLVVEARPEQIEEAIVGVDIVTALDHRGTQGVFEQLAVAEAHLLDGHERVEGLGHRHAHAGLPQDVRELDDLLFH